MTEPALDEGVSGGQSRATATRTRTVAGLADLLLDGTVAVLATWTVVYHAALVVGLGSTTTLLVEAVLLAGALAARLSLRPVARTRAPDAATRHGHRPDPPALVTLVTLATVGLAAVAAVTMALDAPWPLVCASWLAAGAAGTAAAVLRLGGEGPTPPTAARHESRTEAWVALGSAVGLAALSLVLLRPNPDDLFYVNWAQWVAAHGEFPLRDTLYTDLGLPLANWPPIASYDGLVGASAHLLGVRAGSVVYLVVTPVATALAVLALWRLLRAWRVTHVTVALLAALVFLLVDGTASYATPGNLFLTRLWQGKVILACVLVPLLLVHLLRYAERPTPRRLGWLFACGTAAAALSTTAMFLVPVVAAAGVAPMLRHRPRAALAAFAATAGYPLGAGVVTLALGGRSADDFGGRREYRFDPSWFGHEVFLSGPMAFVTVLAVLLGTVLVAHPAARLTAGVAVLAVGATFVPGATRLAYDVVGLGPTLWRLTWALAIAALVGVAVSWLVDRLPSRRLLVVSGVAGALLVGFFGAPIWAEETGTRFDLTLHWQRGEQSQVAADWLVGQARPGEVVMGPDEVAISVVVTQTEVKVVAARDYYLDYLRDDSSFHYDERLALAQFANGDPVTAPADVRESLARLEVRAACVYRDDPGAGRVLRDAGYRMGYRSDRYRCFRR